ncbi:MAG: serine/threonine protein kinase [Polyangiaceae bacterium]|nr:serine/threonine protein kinase [Polyangiaceae bacterium]
MAAFEQQGRGAGPCPDEEALLAYLEAGPAGAGAPALGAHVDGCERCRQVVAALGPLRLDGESGAAGSSGSFAPPPEPDAAEAGRSLAGPAPEASGATTTLASARPGRGAGEAVGEVLAGKYRVLGELGRGGMGVVLEAEHVGVAERFAIKLLRAEGGGGGEGGVRRLLREAKLAAQVGGRHVARVYDVGTLDDGRTFLVMERLSGEDLQATLRRRGALPVAEALGYLVQACEAVGRAHAAGVVHRDLKPANLFLAKEENGEAGAALVVKVLDFGLAKLAARPRLDDELSLTTSATIIGSPRYMSPEQIRDARGVDARSDVWSLGVILFEMLAGEPPFSGTTVSGLWASIVADAPRSLRGLRPELSPALTALVDACLVKDPAARLENVAELARRARAVLAAGDEPAPGPASGRAGGRVSEAKRARSRLVPALSVAAALGLAALGIARSRGALERDAALTPGLTSSSAASVASGAPRDALAAEAPSGEAPRAPASGEASGGQAGVSPVASGIGGQPSAAPKRLDRGRGSKEAGHRVHGAASANDIFFGKETDSRH